MIELQMERTIDGDFAFWSAWDVNSVCVGTFDTLVEADEALNR